MSEMSNYDDYQGNYEYSPGGRNYGNPMFNSIMQLMFGMNYMPSPGQGESVSDAFHKRQRTQDAMGLQRSAFANSQLFKQLGVQGNPMLNTLGQFAGSPDSLAGRVMSPILGGNPMSASMRLYAGLGGGQALNTFGRTEAISGEETEGVMHALAKNMYKSEKYEGGAPGEMTGRQRMIEENKKTFFKMSKSAQGRKNLEDTLGIELGTDASGNVTPESMKELMSIDITAGAPMEGMKSMGGNLANNMEARAATAGSLSEDLSKTIEKRNKNIQEAKNTTDDKLKKKLEDTTKQEEEDFKKKLNEKGKFSAAEIADMSTGGALDPEKVSKELGKFKRPDFAEKSYLESKSKQEAGESFRGYDFAKSRGFKLEDISSAFVESSRKGMLGDRKGQSVAGAMDDFSSHAGGALDAARSIFGRDKSGGELVSEISKIAGNTADLGSQQGSREIEDLLRKTKATAKVAGISIKSMLGIISSVREIAAQNPHLQHMSAAGSTELAIGSTQRAAYRAQGMTQSDLRAAGGLPGLQAKDIASTMDFNQSSLGSGGAALMGSVAGDAKKTDYLKKLISSGKYNQRFLDQGGMGEIAKNLGISTIQANNIYQNEQLGSESLKNDDISKFWNSGVAQTITSETLGQGFRTQKGRGVAGKEAIAAEMKEFLKTKGNTEEMYKTSHLLTQITDPQQAEGFRKYGGDFMSAISAINRGPEDKKRFDEQLERTQQVDKEMAEKYAGLNAPLLTQAIGAVAENRGGTTTEMVDSVTKLFATKGMDPNAQKAARNIAAMSGSKELDENATENMNAIIRARKKRAEHAIMDARAQGRMASDEEYDFAGATGKEDAGELAEAGKRLASNPLIGSAKEAKQRLRELTAQKDAGTLDDKSKQTLEDLTKLKKEGFLSADNVFARAKKGTKADMLSAQLQIEQNYQQKKQLEDIEQNADKTLSDKLTSEAGVEEGGAGGISKALSYYKGDTKKLRQDFLRNQGQFADKSFREEFEKKGGKLVNEAADSITTARKAYEENTALGQVSPEAKQQQELLAALKSLTEAIMSGGSIGAAISQLAAQLIT